MWFRKKKKLRQIDVSEKAQINYRYYQDIESGKKNVTLATMQKLSQVFEISLEELVMLSRIPLKSSLQEFLDENMEKLDKLLGFPVYVRDKDQKVVFASHSFLQKLGIKIEEVRGQQIQNFIGSGDRKLFTKVMETNNVGSPSNYTVIPLKNPKDQIEINFAVLPVCLTLKNAVVGILNGLVPLEEYTPTQHKNFNESLIAQFLV